MSGKNTLPLYAAGRHGRAGPPFHEHAVQYLKAAMNIYMVTGRAVYTIFLNMVTNIAIMAQPALVPATELYSGKAPSK
jgi:hypothetical protein